MTKQDLKLIFSTFQNLNLLTLIEDLRRGLVARGEWEMITPQSDSEELLIRDSFLCPMAHGWEKGTRFVDPKFCNYKLAGFDMQKIPISDRCRLRNFIDWWDNGFADNINTESLLPTLEEIYAERLADADAVQAVIEPVAEEVFA